MVRFASLFALGAIVSVAACSGAPGAVGAGAANDAEPAADTSASDTGDAAGHDTAVDTGAIDSAIDSGGIACGSLTCADGEVCTRTYTSGGACMACNGGCPAGYHCSGACCTVDTPTYLYACKPMPPTCASAPSCAICGAAVCASYCPCEAVSGDTVTCHCLAP